jgi:hypothetical protein
MRIVRPRSIPHVDDARLFDSLAQLDARVADLDQPRGQMVRDAARRCLVQAALADRGHDVAVQGNPAVCAQLFA